MKFKIQAEHNPGQTPVIVEAESWFVALESHVQSQGESVELQQLACTIRADGMSAYARDKEWGRAWELTAQLAPPDGMAHFVSQMRTSWLLLKPYGWIFALLSLGVGAAVYQLAGIIKLPDTTRWVMALLAGGQVSLWVWSGLACKVGITEKVKGEHWQLDRVKRSGLLALVLAALAIGAGWWAGRALTLSIWWLTGLWLLAFSAALFSLYRGTTWLLIQAEFHGILAPGKAGRWMGWTTTGTVLLLGMVLLGLGNFIGGMHWWYNTYVTTERRAEVTQRAKTLRALQLQTLHDKDKRYLGLYTRSESDWSRYYNDPNLLGWKVSQAIQLAEGAVPPPSWWWRYLPDGDALQSEPFSIKAFLRVPYYFLKQRRKVGGSTPALQAAKNFMDFGLKRRDKGLLGTIGLKLFVEIPRAYVMAQRFTPREMLATYMATIWAGRGGNYGLHRMSLYYFTLTNPAQLNWNQAAVLAASLPNPGRFNPWFLAKCREGKCQGPRTTKIYGIWRERIRQVKRMLRRAGHKVPKQLPPFRNGMSRMRTLSHKWLKHDAHIRAWIRKELPHTIPDWQRSSRFQLGYDRTLTLGKSHKPTQTKKFKKTRAKTTTTKRKTKPTSKVKQRQKGKPAPLQATSLVHIVQTQLAAYRQYIPALQIAYTLVNAQDGMINSQYGGDLHVDMALAKKPVVGSTFKVITMLISGYWPNRLPLLNQGRNPKKRHRKKFVYQPITTGHIVRNSHGMAKFVKKRAALSMSANIGFVFMSLRWTWLIDEVKSEEVVRIGLAQMYEDRMKMTPAEAAKRTQEAMQDRRILLRDLRGRLGYRSYLKRWKSRALFEAGKGLAIQEMLAKRSASPQTLTMLLDAESVSRFGGHIQRRWAHHRGAMALAWKGRRDWRALAWLRPLRMELGLRYIIHLAGLVAGFDRKADHLQPVLTMTLGVNNADTRQLAAVASTIAAGRLVHPRLIQRMYRGHKLRYQNQLPAKPLPIAKGTLAKVQQAMNSVLRWGTAARSGRMVAKEHGHKWLVRSGAKTGTVQRSKGVSCVGYLGHYAGALTISTPLNRPLIQYTLYGALEKQQTNAEKQVTRYLQCTKKAIPLSPRARICGRKWRWWQSRALALKTRNDGYKEKANQYLRTGRIWKRSLHKAGQYERKANQLANKARLKHRQAAVYQSYIKGEERMIKLYDRWFHRFNTQAQAQRDKAQKQRKAANTATQKSTQAQQRTQAALDALKRTLKAKKPHKRKSNAHRREWRKLVRRLMRLRHQVRRAQYQVKIFTNRTRHAQRRLASALKRIRDKTPQFHKNKQKQANNTKRRASWLQKQQQTQQIAKKLETQRQEALDTKRRWLLQAAREEAQYNRLEGIVKRTHRRWGLYSSDACALLFQLLGYWKRKEEEKRHSHK